MPKLINIYLVVHFEIVIFFLSYCGSDRLISYKRAAAFDCFDLVLEGIFNWQKFHQKGGLL